MENHLAKCIKFPHRLQQSTSDKSAEINKAYGVITTMSRHLGLVEGKVLGSLAKYTSKQVLWDGDANYGSRANLSNQQPGGREFVDLRLFPLLPSSSSKSHQHQPPQSAIAYIFWGIISPLFNQVG